MDDCNFYIRENKKWIFVIIPLLIIFAGVLTVWIIFFPRDGQRMVIYISGIVIWSIAVLMGVLSVLGTYFKYFSLKGEKLTYCNGYFKKKTINLKDVSKVVIIDRGMMKPYNVHNIIAYKIMFLGKESTLLWFYDVTGSYVVFNQKLKDALSHHRISIDNKTLS